MLAFRPEVGTAAARNLSSTASNVSAAIILLKTCWQLVKMASITLLDSSEMVAYVKICHGRSPTGKEDSAMSPQ